MKYEAQGRLLEQERLVVMHITLVSEQQQALLVCSNILRSWNSKMRISHIWADSVSVVSRKSETDQSVIVSTFGPYLRITAHYKIVCVWKLKNNMFTDTARHHTAHYCQRDFLNRPSIMLMKDFMLINGEGGCHIRLQTHSCGGFDLEIWLRVKGGLCWRNWAWILVFRLPTRIVELAMQYVDWGRHCEGFWVPGKPKVF